MQILNFGSLNLDYVYNVDHFVQPGETLAALSYAVKPGGKGLNQSVALARAGAPVSHAGCLGAGGEILRNILQENGVCTEYLLPVQEAQGHTVIQVDPEGENCILLFGGSNQCVPEAHVRQVIGRMEAGDWLILQNEISRLPLIVELASAKGMHIVLNPSPYNEVLKEVDFSALDWLLVNEIEAEQISVETFREKAVHVRAVDTTAAGDTYTGYFIAGISAGRPLPECMHLAGRAAALAVTRPGAAESIPRRNELD